MATSPPLLALRGVGVTFGGAPVFSDIDFAVGRGDRICLVGRNGGGKSTLLKVLAGTVEPDSGERFVEPGIRIATLAQDVVAAEGATVADFVTEGLPEGRREEEAYRIVEVLDRLRLDPSLAMATLSGGESRRAGLARAFASDPDILLLDEPTNHLDLPTIEWLEGEIAAFRGGVVVISHDRKLLETVGNRTAWLTTGRLLQRDAGFIGFDDWRDTVIAEQEAELHRMDKKLAAEAEWLHRGVTARRRRNQGRLRALMQLRSERAATRREPGTAKMAIESAAPSGRLVVEAEGIGKRYGDRTIIRSFSTRIMRGDRVAVIGPNGAGKTTLLRMLTGDLAPDSGSIRLGTNLVPLYYDQRRESLDPDATLWRTLCPKGGDSVMVRGRLQHVVGYLKDFLFPESKALSPVHMLSGGERSRLLFARLFAQAANFLILDEPTNDLDMETLDLLEELLADFDGTVLFVSHDRDFIDRIATSTILVEGDGRVEEFVGGFSDHLRHKRTQEPAVPAAAKAQPKGEAKPKTERKRLSYKEQRELDQLPGRIETLEKEAEKLEAALADPGLYARDRARFESSTARLEAVHAERTAAEDRWLELEEKRQTLEEAGS
ncbi:MAG: elongation factor 3 [Rhodospirillaceae bacterium]|nr:elongation factor 3 [Rhodospirillaceae bacterium]